MPRIFQNGFHLSVVRYKIYTISIPVLREMCVHIFQDFLMPLTRPCCSQHERLRKLVETTRINCESGANVHPILTPISSSLIAIDGEVREANQLNLNSLTVFCISRKLNMLHIISKLNNGVESDAESFVKSLFGITNAAGNYFDINSGYILTLKSNRYTRAFLGCYISRKKIRCGNISIEVERFLTLVRIPGPENLTFR